MSTPHLTIELPAIIEKPLQQLIGGFKWPPWSSDNLAHSPSVSLRHRIPRKKMDEEESSVRFLESFWPREPKNSHILVLSPHTEITPQFFHCESHFFKKKLWLTSFRREIHFAASSILGRCSDTRLGQENDGH